jgi:ABC-2 type transport system ATP-binding protein
MSVTTSDGTRPPIVVDSISKTFRVPEERVHTLKEHALHPLRRSRHQTFDVLQDISFHVSHGEFFGIAGRNGSGKSTLLKCMAGIYGVNQGRIWMDGRLSTFIELGVGFSQDLAARDNVVLNGIMMGLPPREARRRVDQVIDFAELREFEELKLKRDRDRVMP